MEGVRAEPYRRAARVVQPVTGEHGGQQVGDDDGDESVQCLLQGERTGHG